VFSFLELFFSSCIVVVVARKENILTTPAIVLFANFQCIQILRYLGLASDWPSVSFFDHWPITMLGLLPLFALNYLCSALR